MIELLRWLHKRKLRRAMSILDRVLGEDEAAYHMLSEGAQRIEKIAFGNGDVIRAIHIEPSETVGYNIYVIDNNEEEPYEVF